jgi:predicted flap endonuclease-1-like 5' DNA nuclease
MSHYIIELAIWTLVIFLIGCVLGAVLRHLFGPEEIARRIEPQDEPAEKAPEPATAPVMSGKTVVVERTVAEEKTVIAETPAVLRMERPKGIAEPRGGKPDELQKISGIGPKNEKILHTLGFFHFDQIAEWTEAQISWVDDHLKFNGRIGRENWVEQAKLLAAGNVEEFETRFGKKRG